MKLQQVRSILILLCLGGLSACFNFLGGGNSNTSFNNSGESQDSSDDSVERTISFYASISVEEVENEDDLLLVPNLDNMNPADPDLANIHINVECLQDDFELAFNLIGNGGESIETISCANAGDEISLSFSLEEHGVASERRDITIEISAVSNENSDISIVSETLNYQVAMCPQDFVLIRTDGRIYRPDGFGGSAEIEVDDFCLMAYEARVPSTSIVMDETIKPLHSITTSAAKNYCLNEGWSLPSNPEWLATADEIFQIAIDELANSGSENYSGSAGGLPILFRGNSDNSFSTTDDSSLFAISDADDDWGGISSLQSDPEGATLKRRNLLLSGEYIWDLSGNLAEFVDWSGISMDTLSTASLYELSNFVGYTNASNQQFLPYLSSATHTASNIGHGVFLSSTNLHFAIRGGGYYYGGSPIALEGGLYSLYLQSTLATISPAIGFRCSYRP